MYSREYGKSLMAGWQTLTLGDLKLTFLYCCIMVNATMKKNHLGLVIIIGSMWGVCECLLGAMLQRCAASVSGSLMTGVALLFMAVGWRLTGKASAVGGLVVIASLFKMFDSLILSLPLNHGAVANPIFSFFMEGAAFLVLAAMIKENWRRRIPGQALLGGLAALVAVNLFPLVKYASAVPACVMAGTGYPQALYYAPLAVAVSLITVPLGFLAGERLERLETRLAGGNTMPRLAAYGIPSLTVLLGLALVALAR